MTRRLCFGATLLATLLGAGLAWPETPPQTWVIAVGVDKYLKESVGDLRYAGADAKLISQSFKELAKVPDSNLFTFTSDSIEPELSPRATNIMLRLSWLRSRCRPQDSLIFFFAGHGIVLDQGYLLTEESDNRSADTLKVSSLRTQDLFSQFGSLPTQKILFVFDACRNEGQAAGSSAETSGFSLAHGNREYATLFSCDVGERSWEWAEKRHGFFSYFFADGLRGGGLDANGNVSLQSLTHYLGDTVPTAVLGTLRSRQTPILSYQGKGAERWLLAELHASKTAAGASTLEQSRLVAQLDLARAVAEKAEAERKLLQDELLNRETEVKKMLARLEILERQSTGMPAPPAAVLERDLANENVRQVQKRKPGGHDSVELLEAEKEELRAQNAALLARIRVLELKLGQQDRGVSRSTLLGSDPTVLACQQIEQSSGDASVRSQAQVKRLRREQSLLLDEVPGLREILARRLPNPPDDPVVQFLLAQLQIYTESGRAIESQLATVRKALLERDAQLATAQARLQVAESALHSTRAELDRSRQELGRLEAVNQRYERELVEERQRGDQLLTQLKQLEENTQERFRGVAIDSQWRRICRLVRPADITFAQPNTEPDAQSLGPARKDHESP